MSPLSHSVQVVSDIDFTLCRPQHTQAPFLARCLASHHGECPIFHASGYFPSQKHRCDPQTERDFHLSMGCPKRDAFSEEFYAWLATLDFQNDLPISHTMQFVVQHPSSPILLTNRDEQCRAGTLSFFAKHGIAPQALHMRAKGDYRPLWDFKLETMGRLSQLHPHILWLDDQEPPLKFSNVTWCHPDHMDVLHFYL